MKRLRYSAIAFGLWALLACKDTTTSGPTGILLQVLVAEGVDVALDSGRVVIDGPTHRTARIMPGASVALEGLRPGSYTVSLEGFAANVVELAAASDVQVLAGYITLATLTLAPFEPTVYAVPSPGGISVSVDSLAGAARYTVEWDDNNAFSTPEDTTVAAGTLEIVAAAGIYYVRVKAVGASGAAGRLTTASRVARQALFFVSPTGNDLNTGSNSAPFATIQRGIEAAAAPGTGGAVFVAGGAYPESLALRPKVGVYGAYDAASWQRRLGVVASVVEGGSTAVRGTGADSATVDGLTIIA
ncbi:MAG TPA: DUF1565 domain-containing protein, partial [Gemmatimonadales bacterium]|nr:DUF1565 domain-containing protein [Gemmatimonadales bacterium]